MLPWFRRILKRFHPEGIPFPMSLFYNQISRTGIFQRYYEYVAADIVKYKNHGRLLDVGTGPGWLLGKIHEVAPRMNLTGVDVSPSMVRKGRENLNKISTDISMELGSAESLPFDDETFDLVVSTGSIHHWKNPLAGINECRRVLKPGGWALIYDLLSDTPKDILWEQTREFGKFRVVMMWLHGFEEPFHSQAGFLELSRRSHFQEGNGYFLGAMYGLAMKKEEGSKK